MTPEQKSINIEKCTKEVINTVTKSIKQIQNKKFVDNRYLISKKRDAAFRRILKAVCSRHDVKPDLIARIIDGR